MRSRTTLDMSAAVDTSSSSFNRFGGRRAPALDTEGKVPTTKRFGAMIIATLLSVILLMLDNFTMVCSSRSSIWKQQTQYKQFWRTSSAVGRPIWRSGNGVGHTDKAKLRRAWLVLGLVTTFGGSTILVVSRPLSLANPSWVGAMSISNVSATAGEETASSV